MIKRTKKKNNFTQIGNKILFNQNLSFEAKGVLCMILALPDDWVIHKSWILKKYKIGIKRLNSVFKEIEKEGYLCCAEHIRKEGKFAGKVYLFYDEPQLKLAEQQDVKPSTDTPLATSVERQRLSDIGEATSLKGYVYNTKDNNTYNTNTNTNKTKGNKYVEQPGGFTLKEMVAFGLRDEEGYNTM